MNWVSGTVTELKPRAGLSRFDHQCLEADRLLFAEERIAKALMAENRHGGGRSRKRWRLNAIRRRFALFKPDYTYGTMTAKLGKAGRKRRNMIQRLIARDGDRCWYCGREFADATERSRDHIIPVAEGGPSCIHNLRLACRPCNNKKRNMAVAFFSQHFRAATHIDRFPPGSCSACEGKLPRAS